MSSQKPDPQPKTPPTSGKEELSANELDKVVGGLKPKTGGTTSGTRPTVIGDPCEGGQ
jgi:bacteriocin-like protein